MWQYQTKYKADNGSQKSKEGKDSFLRPAALALGTLDGPQDVFKFLLININVVNNSRYMGYQRQRPCCFVLMEHSNTYTHSRPKPLLMRELFAPHKSALRRRTNRQQV